MTIDLDICVLVCIAVIANNVSWMTIDLDMVLVCNNYYCQCFLLYKYNVDSPVLITYKYKYLFFTKAVVT